MTLPGIISVVVLSVGGLGAYYDTKTDIAINENNIQHITKQLDRIEAKLDKLAD